MRVKVFIELGQDGTYGAYIPDHNPLSFGAIGEGNSAEEAREDFLNVVDAYVADGEQLPNDLTFEFYYDFPTGKQTRRNKKHSKLSFYW